MLPTIQQDVWSKSTPDDWRAALAALERLPSRATFSVESDQQLYFIALEGTTKHGLSEAVKFILRGALGHTFFPQPPELRMQCDKAMEWHERERERARRQDQMQRDRPAPRPEPSAAQRERVARLYADFCKGYEKAAAEETFRLDPDLVAQVPDNPKALIHQRQGKAA